MAKAFIDWLSFTLDKPVCSVSNMLDNFRALLGAHPYLAEVIDIACPEPEWKWGYGRAPYKLGWRRTGITIYDSAYRAEMLIEMSGQFFKQLDGSHVNAILQQYGKRSSRVDIAYDLKISERPAQMMERVGKSRIKARAVITSKTGETAYIGSRKSDQLVRIYQYDEPHPRAGITRVEYQARRKIAKAAIQAILDNDIDAVYSKTCDTFKLPECVHVDAEAADYQLERAERSTSKTLMWIIGTCVPALKKLEEQGVIDMDQFISEYLK